MTLDEARTLLSEIRETSSLAGDWQEHYSVEASRFELLPSSTRDAEPIATITEACGFHERQLLRHAPRYIAALLCLLAAAFAEINRLRAKYEPPQKDYAAEAAMKCNDHLFRRYMIERHDLGDAADQERIVSRLRTVLRIRSRGELNKDPAAAERWVRMKADFEQWRNGR